MLQNVEKAFEAVRVRHGCAGLRAGGGSSLKLKRPPSPRLAVEVNSVSTLMVSATPLSLCRVAEAKEQATQEKRSGRDVKVLCLW